jgi:ABC-type Zn uptake system ZnuABC Zn-binding protein ZnuA
MIVKETEAEILEFHTLTNISETERNNKKDYLSLMNDNIELLKNELYK